jgi:hypothetical protein
VKKLIGLALELRASLILIIVVEWIRDKTSRLIPDVQVQQTQSAFHPHAQ